MNIAEMFEQVETEALAKSKQEIADEKANPLFAQEYEAKRAERAAEFERMRASGAIDESTDDEQEYE